MKTQYAQAFLEMIQEGMSVETALADLRTALAKKNYSKLLVPILLEVQRVLEAQKDAKQARVATASTADAKVLKAKITEALKTLGIEKSTVVKEVVDETLVGGFVATFDYKEYDQSYKRTLKSLFESITK